MNIIDYLHLYLGRDVRAGVKYTAKLAIESGEDEIGLKRVLHQPDVFKLLLRPLSDMTEEELREAMTICYRSVYSSEPSFDSVEMILDESGGGLKAIEHPKWEYGLTVTLDGVMFSTNGQFLNIPVFDVTRYLLSKGFDLFGLIDAGLAIDKTKEVK